MDTHGQIRTRANPMELLRDAFECRRITHRLEDDVLVVNDPYPRKRVDVMWTRHGHTWTPPAGRPCSCDPRNTTDAADRIIQQHAGLHLEVR